MAAPQNGFGHQHVRVGDAGIHVVGPGTWHPAVRVPARLAWVLTDLGRDHGAGRRVGPASAIDMTGVGTSAGAAFLRAYQDIDRAVIMDIPLAACRRWTSSCGHPSCFHFALHSVPGFPEVPRKIWRLTASLAQT